MPRSLLWRSLLMILVPLLLLQAVSLRIFYTTYMDLAARRLSSAVSGEIATTVDLLQRFPGETNRAWILAMARVLARDDIQEEVRACACACACARQKGTERANI